MKRDEIRSIGSVHLRIPKEGLGSSPEYEARIARKLGLSDATIEWLKQKGNGKRGRPRKYKEANSHSHAARQKAYRERLKLRGLTA